MQITARSLWTARNLDALIAAIAGFVLIVFLTRHSGIGVSPDSVSYLSVAANIHDHGAPVDFRNDPLVDFPVFYPLFLNGVRYITGMSALRSAPLLNGLLFALLIYLSGWIMEGFSARSGAWRTRIYRWILLAIIVTSPCLLELYSMIWSETLFLPLLLIFFLLLRRYYLSGSAVILIIAGLIAGLAFVTRYAGVCLIGTGSLLLLCDPGDHPIGPDHDHNTETNPHRRPGPGRRLRQLFLFGGGAFLFPVINLVHNKLAGGVLVGHREKGITSFSTNLHDFGSVFCDWLHLPNDHYVQAAALGSGWILLFVGIFTWRLAKKRIIFSYEHIAIVFFIVYAIFILFSATVSRFQQLDSRLLSPLFIPWLWGSTSMIPEWIASRKFARRAAFILPVFLAAAGFLAGQWLADRETWEDVRDAGIPGYTDDDWRSSETMAFVRKNTGMLLPPSAIYSNADDALWFLGSIHANRLPHKDFPNEIVPLLAKDRFYVVRFNDGINTDLVDIAFISRYKKLAGVYPFDDGDVYFFTGK